MIKIGYVVLNYKNYQDTIRCVESLLRQANVQPVIAIVDNASRNRSVDVLRDRFGKNTNCHIIEAEKNLGFAKGNNLGINFLRKEGINFIWLTNSDTIFTDKDITQDAVSSYKKGIGIINVTSYLMDGRKNYHVCYRKKFIYLRMIKSFFYALVDFCISPKKKNNYIDNSNFDKERIESLNRQASKDCSIQEQEYIITGSVFLLTEDFFRYYEGLFPETFFYCEETATIIFLHKAKLSTAIVNTGIVLHRHGGSTTSTSMKKYGLQSRKKIIKLFFMTKRQIARYYFAKNI